MHNKPKHFMSGY